MHNLVDVRKHQSLIAGVDEAGRGPLAGPVVAASVILFEENKGLELKDSKKLSEKKREQLCQTITQNVLCWGVGHASAEEIDQINILQASLLAMKRAIDAMPLVPEKIWVDGTHAPKGPWPTETFIKGDDRFACISAASIIAKVFRDRYLSVLHLQHPHYEFQKHKGYGTKKHLELLNIYGASKQHRRSFAPVKRVVEEVV